MERCILEITLDCYVLTVIHGVNIRCPVINLLDLYSLMATVFMWEHTKTSVISAATPLVYLNTLPYGTSSKISRHTTMKYGIYSK